MGNHHQIISVNIYSDIVVPRSIHEKFQKSGLKIPNLFNSRETDFKKFTIFYKCKSLNGKFYLLYFAYASNQSEVKGTNQI